MSQKKSLLPSFLLSWGLFAILFLASFLLGLWPKSITGEREQEGIRMRMKLDAVETVSSWNNNTYNEELEALLQMVKEKSVNDKGNFIDLIAEANQSLFSGKKLSRFFFGDSYLGIQVDMSDEEVIQKLNEGKSIYLEEQASLLEEQLREIQGPTKIKLLEQEGQVSFILIDSTHLEQLQTPKPDIVKLAFWETYRAYELIAESEKSPLSLLNTALNENPKYNRGFSTTIKNTGVDTLYPKIDPLLSKLGIEEVTHPNDLFVAAVKLEDTAIVSDMLHSPDAARCIPKGLEFMWSKELQEGNDGVKYASLYALKTYGKEEAELNGSHVKSAFPMSLPDGEQFGIALDFNSEGGRIWKNMTSRNIDKSIAVCMNNQVLSVPRVMEPISGGNTQISGGFTAQEAAKLANMLMKVNKKGLMLKPIEKGQVDIKTDLNLFQTTLYILFGSLGMALLYVAVIYLIKQFR